MKAEINFTIPDNIIRELSTLIMPSKTLSDLPFEKISGLRLKLFHFFTESNILVTLYEKSGIICLNYNINNQLNLSHQYLLSTSVFHLVNTTIFKPTIDIRNNTPFTIFKSIFDINELNTSNMNSPEKKLGYHNDLFIKNGKFYLPKFVSLLNLYIGYNEGGNFYYVNKNNWDSFNHFFENGKTKLFSYEAPTLVYENNTKETHTAPKSSNFHKIPAFWEVDKERYVFFNDSLISLEEPDFVNNLNNSLINNSFKIKIPQKINQIILLRNDIGFHCRDIFRKPIVSKGISRMFLRAVSDESILFPDESYSNYFN